MISPGDVSPAALISTICCVAILVCERNDIRRSYLVRFALVVLLLTICSEIYPKFMMLAGTAIILIGCIYIIVEEKIRYTKSWITKYAMICILVTIEKAQYPESDGNLIVISCMSFVLQIIFNIEFKTGAMLFRTRPKIPVLFRLTVLLFFLGLPRWVDSIVAVILVVPAGYFLMYYNNERSQVINEQLSIWDMYECKHGLHQDYEVIKDDRIFRDLIFQIKMHVLLGNPTIETQHFRFISQANILSRDESNEPKRYMTLLEKLVGDDYYLAKIDGNERYLLSECLLTLGTNLLLRDHKGDLSEASTIAMFISLFEQLPPKGKLTSKDLMSMSRSFTELGKRGITKFYSKRIKCSCLNTKYESLDKEAKQGICSHCKKVKKPKQLLLCAKCWSRQYCCKACQRYDWENGHKGRCKSIAKSTSKTLELLSNQEHHEYK